MALGVDRLGHPRNPGVLAVGQVIVHVDAFVIQAFDPALELRRDEGRVRDVDRACGAVGGGVELAGKVQVVRLRVVEVLALPSNTVRVSREGWLGPRM